MKLFPCLLALTCVVAYVAFSGGASASEIWQHAHPIIGSGPDLVVIASAIAAPALRLTHMPIAPLSELMERKPAGVIGEAMQSLRDTPAVPPGLLSAARNGPEDEGLSRGDQRNLKNSLGEIRNAVDEMNVGLRRRVDQSERKIEGLETRIHDYEQHLVSSSHRSPGRSSSESWGDTVANSDGYRDFVSNSCRGSAKISVRGAITSISTSGGALIRPDRDTDVVMLPRRRMTVRALLGSGRTSSNLVEFTREKLFTNNANVVSEGAQKPESNIEYGLDNAKVVTIAHWIPVSRQAMDDAGQLGTLIDGSLRYGLAIKEEGQFLYGDGTGENLHGMIPQATEFEADRIVSGDTDIDIIRHAISQAEEADLPASGIILNTRDWLNMIGIKDANGNYMSNGPWIGGPGTLWGLPVVWTNSIFRGDFLVGAFETATQIWDRMDPEVLVSAEDRDNFIKNMLTVRGEERLAFAVKRAAALITGSLSSAGSGT